MNFSRLNPLYIASSIKHPERILKKLNKGKLFGNYYILTIAGGSDQIDIYPSYCLFQPFYQKHSLELVGLAGDYKEAVDLVIAIVNDSLKTTGECDLKKYLYSRQG